MKISEILNTNKTGLSMEMFPPKTWDAYESVEAVAGEIAKLSPSYMSVTYGAGGGTSDFTVKIASHIEKTYNIPALAHLTCISSTHYKVKEQLEKLKEAGISNILALRGDIPQDYDMSNLDYHYASELIAEIKEFDESFCIGAACYPEVHPESVNYMDDIRHLKEKVEAGCDFLTTQMFFDNGVFYNFMYRLREEGVEVPVIAGIMPVTNPKSIIRTCKLCGATLPQRFRRIVDKFGSDPDSMKQAGIAYATEQIIDLYANGVNAVHVYCMNKPDVAKAIMNNVSSIINKG